MRTPGQHPAGAHLRHQGGRQRELVFRALFLILFLSQYFHEMLGGSTSTAYVVAVVGALGYFASLILHELGHALVSRRLGIPILGIDLWFFGGMARPAREPETAGEEFKVSAAGPAVTLRSWRCAVAIVLIAGSGTHLQGTGGSSRLRSLAWLTKASRHTGCSRCLAGLLFINARSRCSTSCPPSRSTAGASRAPAIWWRTGDRHRGTRITGRAGQGFAMALGLWACSRCWRATASGCSRCVLGLILYQASGGAVMQGAIGQRIQSVTRADIMDREPTTIPAELKLLDAQEQFFPRYRSPWFAVWTMRATSSGWCARSESTRRSRRDARRWRSATCSSRTCRCASTSRSHWSRCCKQRGARAARRDGRRGCRWRPAWHRHGRADPSALNPAGGS